MSLLLRFRRLALFMALTLPVSAFAADALDTTGSASDVPAPGYKFTTGLYQLSGAGLPVTSGLDLNLRVSAGFGNAWLGWYRAPQQQVSQSRVGWDSSYAFGPLRFMPSLQAASGGFWGGSASLEAGSTWFAGLGLGRTNLRNYVNLNFDPNDAWMLSGGYRWDDKQSLALQVVRDNRLNPDQQHVHLVWRTPLADQQRLTLDLLAKKGLVNAEPIQRLGLSVVYDWPRFFVHAAWDPKVNFTPQDMFRLSVGTRF